ncbi:caspase family protein [Pelagicoccus sp. SDUM812002]|uniref:caspase family protein n=1 Tax=Pelagicoccus sp. SDUM812002 TaxID=3041266 RepID=UPI00280F1A49|nr:caspase family protein [Pelagicoccus sp. SDUM812002]MDQ8186865.1 caspase family protein [Pelagicoccus sp. SDUM812002]
MRPITQAILFTFLLSLLPFAHAQLTPELILSTGLPHNTPHIALSPDGETTLTTQFDGTAIFYETATGRTLNSVDLEHDRYTSPYIPIFASKDTVYFLSEKRVRTFDLPSYSFSRDLNVPEPTAYARDASSGQLYIAGQRGQRATIWTVDPSNGRIRPFHTCAQEALDPITRISLAPRENLALITFKSGTAELLKTGRTWVVAKTYPASKDQRFLLPDGHILTASEGYIDSITLTNPADASPPVEIALPKKAPVVNILTPISPNKPTLVSTREDLFQLDPSTRQLVAIRSFKNESFGSQTIRRITASADHDYIFVHAALNFDYALSFVLTPATKQFNRWQTNAFRPEHIHASSTSRTLLVNDSDGLVKRIDFTPAGLSIASQKGQPLSQISLATQSNQIAIGGISSSYQEPNYQSATLYPPAFSKPTTTLKHRGTDTDNNRRSSTSPILSPSGNHLVIVDPAGFHVRTSNGTFLWKFPHKPNLRPSDFAFDSDESRLFFHKSQNNNSKSTVVAIELRTGKQLWEIPAHATYLRYDPADNALRFATTKSYRSNTSNGTKNYIRHFVNTVDADTGAAKREPTRIDVFADYPDIVAATPDGRRWVFQDNKTLRIVSAPYFKNPSNITIKKRVSSGAFLAGNNHLAALSDNRIAFFDTDAPTYLGELSLLQSDAQWAFVNRDGLFDATPAAQSALNFAFGLTPAPLASFYEPYFRPRLLNALFEGQAVTPPTIDIATLAQPPATKITLLDKAANSILDSTTTEQNEILLNVAIASPATPLREVRVFHNGKRLNLATRGLFVEDDEPETTDSPAPSYNQNRQFPIQLLPGDNTLTVVALNAQNIESPPAELSIHLKADPNKTQPALHLVAIGIDQYQNEKYNLNYAVADATAFASTLQQNSTPLFSTVNYHPVKNDQAIKANLVTTLEEIQKTATPDDVFIFYYAGHGVVAKQGQGDFYLVPHDVTQLYGADDQLQSRAVSSIQLQELSSQISAQKQLFILDACQSAGAIASISQRGAAEERAIAQLARSTGTHWLTASGSQQFATEFAELGHGAFTYTLLQALNGAADTGDSQITVNELKAYLESQVPEVTAKHKGTAQYPASYGYGQDFPIAILP